jgi:hypothetical protein
MAGETQQAEEAGPSHRWVEVGVALLTLAFGILILVGSLQVGVGWGIDGPQAGFFPFYISLFIIVASIINLVQVTNSASAKDGVFSTWEQLMRVLSVVVPTTVYVALIPILGIYVSSGLLIVVFMMWLGNYNIWMTVPIAVGIPVVTYIVFERYFQIALPKGPIEAWLGL